MQVVSNALERFTDFAGLGKLLTSYLSSPWYERRTAMVQVLKFREDGFHLFHSEAFLIVWKVQ